jgi:hypothetical protein
MWAEAMASHALVMMDILASIADNGKMIYGWHWRETEFGDRIHIDLEDEDG